MRISTPTIKSSFPSLWWKAQRSRNICHDFHSWSLFFKESASSDDSWVVVVVLQTLHTELSHLFHESWWLEKITKTKTRKKVAAKTYWNKEVISRHYIVWSSFFSKYAKNPFSIKRFNIVDSFDWNFTRYTRTPFSSFKIGISI